MPSWWCYSSQFAPTDTGDVGFGILGRTGGNPHIYQPINAVLVPDAGSHGKGATVYNHEAIPLTPTPRYPLVTFTTTPNVARVPHLRHLLPSITWATTPQLLRELRTQEAATGLSLVESLSRCDPSKRWEREDLTGQRVGYWQTGHIGDACAGTAILAQLGWDYPGIELNVFAMGPAGNIFTNNRDVAQVHPFFLAIPAEVVASFPYWIIPAPLPYLHRGRETNYYDELETATGLQIACKRPYLYTTEHIRAAVTKWLSQNSEGACPPHPFVLVQVTASQKERTPKEWHPRLAAMVEAMPDHWFVVAGDAEGCRDLVTAPRLPRTIMALRNGGVELTPVPALMELARVASLVVTPDSLSLHLAAAWDTPCLALFQNKGTDADRIPPPLSRIGSYPHALAVPMNSDIRGVAALASHMERS